MSGYTIGQLAKACGLSADTLRYYERMGLLQPAGRRTNGYRIFPPQSLRRLQFIQRAKLLNFKLEEIKDLFLVRGNPQSRCEEIYRLLEGKILEIDAQIVALKTFKSELQTIAEKCPRGSTSLAACSLMDFLDSPATCCHAQSRTTPGGKQKNGRSKIIAAILMLLGVPVTADAKPIPFKDGWMIMQENNTKENLFHAVYGFAPKMAAGVSSEWFKDNKYWLHTAQINYLAARKNYPDAQVNLFFMSGAGAALKNGDARPAGWVGMLADYETRRWFFSYDNNYTYAHRIESAFSQKAKIGVAPYIGQYSDLHTWVMVQFEHYPDTGHEYVVTPLLRFYKDAYLVEVGYSSSKNILFNWNVTF